VIAPGLPRGRGPSSVLARKVRWRTEGALALLLDVADDQEAVDPAAAAMAIARFVSPVALDELVAATYSRPASVEAPYTPLVPTGDASRAGTQGG
jgi:hypothetical protein